MTTRTEKAFANNPTFDAVLFNEALSLQRRLPPSLYCALSREILNKPDPMQRIVVTGGIRALSSSSLAFAGEPHGILGATLFYLASLCEGVVMPQLQCFIELAAEEGNRGPAANSHEELKRARSNFGPAIKFLNAYAGPTLLPAASTIHATIAQWETEKLSKLRNSIAHFKFDIEIEIADALKDPEVIARLGPQPLPARTTAIAAVATQAFKLMDLPAHHVDFPSVPDHRKSRVRWEENLGRPLNKNSRVCSFEDIRTIISRLERFGYSSLFAHVELGLELQNAGKIKMKDCACGDGTVVVVTADDSGPCPSCDQPVTF